MLNTNTTYATEELLQYQTLNADKQKHMSRVTANDIQYWKNKNIKVYTFNLLDEIQTSRIRCFNSWSVRNEGLYDPSLEVLPVPEQTLQLH